MKSQQTARNERRRVFIGIVFTLFFAVLMGSAIVYFYNPEPNVKGMLLKQYGDKLEDSAVTAHYQWDAEGRPEMIMLVHYNAQGKEVDRRPVRMAYGGWPKVEKTSEGCKKLWKMMLNQPLEIQGFLVRGAYYKGDLFGDEENNAYCRFSLSGGDFFDYKINGGDVTYDE